MTYQESEIFIMDVTAKADQIAASASQATGASRKLSKSLEGTERKTKQALPTQERDLIENEDNTSDSEDDVVSSIKDIVRVPHPVLTAPQKI
jgi:hypothetical protein